MDTKSQLQDLLRRDQDVQVKLLQDFIRAASPNPPGNTEAASAVIKKFLEARKIPSEVHAPKADAINIVSEFQGGQGPGPRVVLNGHIDVFPVGDGSGWSRDPWSGDIEGDRIHGRGVVDMKSGTASLVIAYAALYEMRQSLTGSVALCAVSDEETGGKWGTKWLLEKDKARWGGDVMLSAEPSACSTTRFSEKGTLRLTATIHTKGAHGAYLNLSKGAIRTAVSFLGDVIKEVEGLTFDIPREIADHFARQDVLDRVDEAMGKDTSTIIARPTVNIGTIKGGLKVNMIPDTCEVQIDIRLPVGLTAERVLEVIDSIVARYGEARIEIQPHVAASNPASFSTLKHKMLEYLGQNAADISGKRAPLAVPSMGATDCKHYRYAGIPAYVFGCSPISMAGIDEFALISEFLHVTQVHASSVWDFLVPQSK